MKTTSFVLLMATTASGFTNPSLKSPVMSLKMSNPNEEEILPTTYAAPVITEPPIPTSSMSKALPFMTRPWALDGSMVGDVGFDPLGFAKTKDDLVRYREAEIKHSRLAMLAAAGWPLSELWDKKVATMLDLPALVDGGDRVPSLLNGGLGKVSPIYWVVILLLGGAIDLYGISRAQSNSKGYTAGNLGFDPLGLYPKDTEGQKDMQLKEIKNGRLAMIAVTAFSVQEFVSKIGVVDETPIFFKPLGQALHEYANGGYIQ